MEVVFVVEQYPLNHHILTPLGLQNSLSFIIHLAIWIHITREYLFLIFQTVFASRIFTFDLFFMMCSLLNYHPTTSTIMLSERYRQSFSAFIRATCMHTAHYCFNAFNNSFWFESLEKYICVPLLNILFFNLSENVSLCKQMLDI